MNKGGRPKKENPRNKLLVVTCTVSERKVIKDKAQMLHISISQFLRELGIKGHVDTSKKPFPKEVLLMTATLNQMATNINQLAKKSNQNEDLHSIEKSFLNVLAEDVKQLAVEIRNYLK